MRTFTIGRFMIFTVLCALILAVTAEPVRASQILPGIPITTESGQVVGVAVLSRMFTFPVIARDANGRATAWDFDHPEAVWDQTMGVFPEITSADYLRVVIDPVGMGSPEMRKKVTGYSITTDMKNNFDASHVAGTGWAVDFRPGTLPFGVNRLHSAVVHFNDFAGFNLGPIPFRWDTEGQLASGVGVIVREAPPEFDLMQPKWRQKYRSGFRAVNIQSIEASLTADEQKELAAMREALVAQKAAAEAERQRQELIASGACTTCMARGEMVKHLDGRCPRLHPSASIESVPPAPQSVRPAQRQQNPNSSWASVPAPQPDPPTTIQFLHNRRPVTGSVNLSDRDARCEGAFVVQATPGARGMRLRMRYPSGATWQSDDETTLSRTMVFADPAPVNYVVAAQVQDRTGRWSTWQTIRIYVR